MGEHRSYLTQDLLERYIVSTSFYLPQKDAQVVRVLQLINLHLLK